jgi:hypothetical protein
MIELAIWGPYDPKWLSLPTFTFTKLSKCIDYP